MATGRIDVLALGVINKVTAKLAVPFGTLRRQRSLAESFGRRSGNVEDASSFVQNNVIDRSFH